jgi:hypothetical protein
MWNRTSHRAGVKRQPRGALLELPSRKDGTGWQGQKVETSRNVTVVGQRGSRRAAKVRARSARCSATKGRCSVF